MGGRRPWLERDVLIHSSLPGGVVLEPAEQSFDPGPPSADLVGVLGPIQVARAWQDRVVESQDVGGLAEIGSPLLNDRSGLQSGVPATEQSPQFLRCLVQGVTRNRLQRSRQVLELGDYRRAVLLDGGQKPTKPARPDAGYPSHGSCQRRAARDLIGEEATRPADETL